MWSVRSVWLPDDGHERVHVDARSVQVEALQVLQSRQMSESTEVNGLVAVQVKLWKKDKV